MPSTAVRIQNSSKQRSPSYPFIATVISLFPSPSPANHRSVFYLYNFAILIKLYKWNHTVFFTRHTSHPCLFGFESELMENMNLVWFPDRFCLSEHGQVTYALCLLWNMELAQGWKEGSFSAMNAGSVHQLGTFNVPNSVLGEP